MYSKAERQKAVDLYIKYGRRGGRLMPYVSAQARLETAERLRMNMRKLFFSNAGIDWCVENASGKALAFVDELFQREAARRDASRRVNMIKQAGFPVIKTIDNFDLSRVKLPQSLTRESLLGLEFIERKHSLIMYGACGTGKTALSICLGMLACEKGYRVRFSTLSQFLLLLHAHHNHPSLLTAFNDTLHRPLFHQACACLPSRSMSPGFVANPADSPLS